MIFLGGNILIYCFFYTSSCLARLMMHIEVKTVNQKLGRSTFQSLKRAMFF